MNTFPSMEQARREKIDLVHLKVSTNLTDARLSSGHDMGGDIQVCGPRSQEDSIETMCKGIQDEEAKQNSKSLICFSDVLCSAVPPLEAVKALVSIMMSVFWSSDTTISAERIFKVQPRYSCTFVFQQKIVRNMA